jgi:DNA-damage-inducible protein J
MAQVSIRIDDNVKSRADRLFGELGLSISSAVNIFLRQVLRSGGLPFPVTVQKPDEYYNEAGELVRDGYPIPKGQENDPFYSSANLRYLNNVVAKENAGTVKVVRKTIEELAG